MNIHVFLLFGLFTYVYGGLNRNKYYIGGISLQDAMRKVYKYKEEAQAKALKIENIIDHTKDEPTKLKYSALFNLLKNELQTHCRRIEEIKRNYTNKNMKSLLNNFNDLLQDLNKMDQDLKESIRSNPQAFAGPLTLALLSSNAWSDECESLAKDFEEAVTASVPLLMSIHSKISQLNDGVKKCDLVKRLDEATDRLENIRSANINKGTSTNDNFSFPKNGLAESVNDIKAWQTDIGRLELDVLNALKENNKNVNDDKTAKETFKVFLVQDEQCFLREFKINKLIDASNATQSKRTEFAERLTAIKSDHDKILQTIFPAVGLQSNDTIFFTAKSMSNGVTDLDKVLKEAEKLENDLNSA